MRPLAPPRAPAERAADLDRLAGRIWDLLVVGGGATGAAVARDAALRGLTVALVEQDDLAAGTSSRTSRLIHGGIRYLAQLRFELVREGLDERRRLLRTAPGLVRPIDFVYPVHRGDPDPLWRVDLGLWLYDLLARGALGRHRRLRPEEVCALVPGLRAAGLVGGIAYRDAAAHDARLTLAVALAARAAGATVVTRCRAEAPWLDGGRLAGFTLHDRLGGGRFRARAGAAVLCCGPWQELLAGTGLRLRAARGTHLALPAARLPLLAHVALRAPGDGRLAFAMPAGGYTVVGTTDDDDPSPPAEVRPTSADVAYLLALLAHAFPATPLQRADVVGCWAGLRPLLAGGAGGETEELSRRHVVVAAAPGLWAVAGGKLTSHRRMAADAVRAVLPALPGRHGRRGRLPPTRRRPLLPGSLAAGRRRLAAAGVEAARLDALEGLYGARLERLAAAVEEEAGAADPVLAAQVRLAVDEEWALGLDDLLLRRLEPGPLDLYACWRDAPAAARLLGARLGWSAAEEAEQVAAFRGGVASDLAAAGLRPPAD